MNKRYQMVIVFLMSVLILMQNSLSVSALQIQNEEGIGIQEGTNEDAAIFAGGDGTKDNPYIIENKEQLNHVRENLSAFYQLSNNIYFTEEDFSEMGDFYNSGNGFEPIGNYYNPFTGRFDGAEYAIYGLFQRGDDAYTGLFGNVENATICNLSLYDGKVSSAYEGSGNSSYVGAVIACAKDSNISNLCNYNKVTAGYLSSGSNIGYLYCGGVVGYSNKMISKGNNFGELDCFSRSSVNSYVGGVIGSGSAEKSSNNGSIFLDNNNNSTAFIGGISGYAFAIEKCYNNNSIIGRIGSSSKSYINAGGLCGLITNHVENCYSTVSPSVSYANSTSGGTAGTIVGILGRGSTIDKSYTFNGIYGKNESGSSVTLIYILDTSEAVTKLTSGYVYLSRGQMQSEDWLTELDFENTWTIDSGSSYSFPQLIEAPHYMNDKVHTVNFYDGDQIVFTQYVPDGSVVKEQLLFKEHFWLQDWYYINDGERVTWDFSENIVTCDIDLYANWEGRPYYIAYDKNNEDAEGIMEKQTVAFGESASLNSNQFVLTDYHFKEWNTKADGAGESFQNEDIILDISDTNGGTVKLFAIWERHNWNSGIITEEATCEKNGIKIYTCTICEDTRREDIPKSNSHIWNSGIITKQATTMREGEKTYTCIVCNETKIEAIPKLTETTDNNKTPGFTNNKAKKSQNIQVATSKKISAKKVAKKAQSFKLSAKSTSGSKVKYKLVKKNKNIKFAASSGKVTVKKGVKKGTYKIKVKMTVSGNDMYDAYSAIKTIKIKVK